MYLLFDIGRSKIRISYSFDGLNIVDPIIFQTPVDFEQAIKEIKDRSFQLLKGEKIKVAAGGVRALDRTKKHLIDHPNLPLWVNQPLHDRLQEALNAPVYLENDANMVGLGEAVEGAGKGHAIVAYITISSGIGGARIVEGKIDKNTFGFEPGHQIVYTKVDTQDRKFEPLSFQLRTLEELASGSAIQKRYHKRAEDVEKIVLQEIVEYIAIGLNNVIVTWSPEVVVLGGGVMNDLDIDLIREKTYELLKIFPEKPEIKKAILGETGGLIGALKYLNP